MSWEIFVVLSRQPVVGFGFIAGIDMGLFPHLCQIKGVPLSDQDIILDKVMRLSTIGLKYWNAKKGEQGDDQSGVGDSDVPDSAVGTSQHRR